MGLYNNNNNNNNNTVSLVYQQLKVIGNFRVAFCLCFKASPSAKPFIWKLVLFTQILVHLHVNKTNFHMKGFTLRLAFKQRRKATWKSPIACYGLLKTESKGKSYSE